MEEECKGVILWKALESQPIDIKAGNLWEFMVILRFKNSYSTPGPDTAKQMKQPLFSKTLGKE